MDFFGVILDINDGTLSEMSVQYLKCQ